MNIKINGKDKEVDDSITIDRLILDLKLVTRKVAVELNGNVETDFSTKLKEGDVLEIVYFVGGG